MALLVWLAMVLSAAPSLNDDVRLAGVHGVELELTVADSADHLWRFFSDCTQWPAYLPFVLRCTVIDRSVERPTFRMSLQIGSHHYDVLCEAGLQRPIVAEFRRRAGDLRDLRGRVSLTALGPGNTRVRYALAADVSWYAPETIVRRHLLDLMPQVAAGLQGWTAGHRFSDAPPAR